MSLNDHPLIPQLGKIFVLLGSASSSDVANAHARLVEIVEEEGDISMHRAHRLNSVSKALSELIKRHMLALFTQPATHKAAVLATATLASVEFTDINARTALFSSGLCKIITENMEVGPQAASVWGTLMSNGCGVVGDLVESQARTSLEWLAHNSHVQCRFAACLLLEQVAAVSPSTLTTRLPETIHLLEGALRDTHESTRVVAARALSLVFALAFQSGKATDMKVLFDEFLKVANHQMVAKQPEAVHGAILSFNAFLRANAMVQDQSTLESSQAVPTSLSSPVFIPFNRKLLYDGWVFISTTLSKPTKLTALTLEMINTIPLLACFDPIAFTRDCMHDIVPVCVSVLKNAGAEEKAHMFLAIGRLGTAIPDKVAFYIDRIVKAIEANLITNKKAKKERCPAAVSCLAMLATANRRCVRPYVLPMLDALFSTVPSVGFAKDLSELTTALPELHSMCMDRMIAIITAQLRSLPVRTASSPRGDGDGGTVTLLGALDALSHLNFRGYSLLSFISTDLTQYLIDPHPAVRRAAAQLIARLMLSGCSGPSSPCRKVNNIVIHSGHVHTQLILKVQRQLIAVAVADADSDIRLSTLELLTEEFDQTLALQDCIRSLVPALNDKHINRLSAVRLLGRLSRRNPGCVLSVLRKVVVQCTTELEHFNSEKKQEQATSVLGTLIESAPSLIQPYTKSLMALCVQRLNDESVAANVMTALLSCVARLIHHVQGAELEAARRLKPLVVRHITDSASTLEKQEAIRALGSIIRATTDVSVYEEFPQLLPSLLSSLYGGFKEPWPVRRDVLLLMGIAGAVDPVKVKSLNRAFELGKSSDAIDPISLSRSRGDDIMAQIVVGAILEVLQMVSSDSNDERCTRAVRALVDIFSSRMMKLSTVVGYMTKVIPALLRHIRSQAHMRRDLFLQLTILVSVVKFHIRGNLEEIFDVVKLFIRGDNPEVLDAVVQLLVELRLALNEEFKPFLPSVLPLLVQAVSQDPSYDKVTVPIVFSCFEDFGTLMNGQLHVVLPCVVDIASSTFLSHAPRVRAVNTILIFAKHLSSIDEHAARCTHCLCRILQEDIAGRPAVPHQHAPPQTQGAQGVSSQSVAASFNAVHPLHHECISAILALVQNLGVAYEKYVPMARQVVQARFGPGSTLHATFMSTVEHAITSGQRHITEPIRRVPPSQRSSEDITRSQQQRHDADRFKTLRGMLTTIDRSTEDEWKNWLRQVSVELMKASSSPALRVSVSLAQVYDPFARQLFHPAFATCYAEMDEATRTLVMTQLTNALRSNRLPSEVLQELLNLAEYMERLDDMSSLVSSNQATGSIGGQSSSSARSPHRNAGSGSPGTISGGLFDVATLTERSERCHLHAKAIHYLEAQFFELTREFERGMMLGKPTRLAPTAWKELLNVCEKCIALNNMLGQNETANGILTFIQKHFSRLTGERQFTVTDASLYGKLGWWTESYRAYHHRYKNDPENPANIVGLMRAMEALGDFSRMLEVWKLHQRKTNIGKRDMQHLSGYVAKAAWLLQRWDDLKVATDHMSAEGYSGTTAVFYQAVQRTHERRFDVARDLIERCRKQLDKDLSALVAESYDRAYAHIVGLQQLAELEEIIALQSSGSIAGADRLRVLWEKRLLSMAQDPQDWQGTLANHSLAMSPEDELSMWVHFVALCRNQGRERMSDGVLLKLQGGRTIQEALQVGSNAATLPNIQVVLASLSHVHETGKMTLAIGLMRQFIEAYTGGENELDEVTLALCRARLGEWLAASNADHAFIKSLSQEILDNLQQATELDPTNKAIWHSWALVNQKIAQRLGEHHEALEQSIIAAIEGFLNAICTADDRGDVQDVLGFLSLYFTHGSRRDVDAMVSSSIGRINVNSWLRVIPQIVARLYTPQRNIGDTIRGVLMSIAKLHPQALLYTLYVNINAQHTASAVNDDIVERRKASLQILDEIVACHSDGLRLTNEAKFVSWELIRCAMLWSELWFDQLEQAHAAWERDKDAEALYETLAPLHQMMSRPETSCEEFFVHEFGKLINDAISCINEYITTRKPNDMAQAWELFRKFYQKVEPQVWSMTSLVMQFVAPKLVEQGRNMLLVVPGMYSDSAAFPRIASFVHTMRVIGSKQHPRRIGIIGDDGRTYKFLLKGHEDLRQDERVVQLLGFFNTLIESYPQTRRRDYTVEEYSVTPIGPTAGLVGWVDNCETFEQLIKDYRATKGIPADREFTLMKGFIDNLKVSLPMMTVVQRVEILECTQEHTDGMDLARTMWIRAPNAETWLDRRTTYVRTLAAMSMVGHILGLGDRHLSNLMIHTFSGRVVHIDFGDCFEVAQTRAMVPEKVPFRLTRMLVKCMEISGIDGLFRHSCIAVMEMLRAEKNSMLAMLEAFVSDPLISWRLATEDVSGKSAVASTGAPPTSGNGGNSANVQEQQQQQQHGSASLLGVGVANRRRDQDFEESLHHTAKSSRYRAALSVRGGGAAGGGNADGGAHVKRAQKVIARIREKLEGVEFSNSPTQSCAIEPLKVPDQVQRLIEEATSNENLAQHFFGWCAFW